jgi:hypothetical protein
MIKNSQVKAGMTATFKHDGVLHAGIVRSIAGGPEPSGASVTLDGIYPKIQGQPTVTVDATELELPAQTSIYIAHPGVQTIPTAQPQPKMSFYGTSALNLLPRYNRAGYLHVAGFQPPSYDPAKLTKSWAATEDEAGNPITKSTKEVTFHFWSPQGNNAPKWETLTITGEEALSFNIPGLKPYPAYVIAKTPAYQAGTLNPIPPDQLSTIEQAFALAASWGMTPAQASAAIADTYDQQFPSNPIVYNGETRHWLTISWPDPMSNIGVILINVGEELALMYAAGVGAPGSWIVSGPQYVANSDNPLWVSTQPTEAPPINAIVPVPQRALRTGEKFIEMLMGVEIENTLAPE